MVLYIFLHAYVSKCHTFIHACNVGTFCLCALITHSSYSARARVLCWLKSLSYMSKCLEPRMLLLFNTSSHSHQVNRHVDNKTRADIICDSNYDKLYRSHHTCDEAGRNFSYSKVYLYGVCGVCIRYHKRVYFRI